MPTIDEFGGYASRIRIPDMASVVGLHSDNMKMKMKMNINVEEDQGQSHTDTLKSDLNT